MRLTTEPLRIAPRCDVPGPSWLGMTGFLPTERYPDASSHLPLAASIVGSARDKGSKETRFRLTAGEPFRYRIALRNVSKRPFHFRSCPVYLEGLASLSRYQRHVLNCRPVGTLAAGGQVLFEMVFHVPTDAPAGNNGLGWELGPKTAQPTPFADAPVRVTR